METKGVEKMLILYVLGIIFLGILAVFIMARIDTDNLIKLMVEDHLITNSTAVQSAELDLELPRGYIAKIRKVVFSPFFDTNRTATITTGLFMALVRDPDDPVTERAPRGVVQHDVIAEFVGTYFYDTVTETLLMTTPLTLTFTELEDVITARNLRFNAQTNVAVTDEISFNIEVYYTLEKVTDLEILDLLDIL